MNVFKHMIHISGVWDFIFVVIVRVRLKLG